MSLAEPHAPTLAKKRLARTSIDHTASNAASDDLATMVEQVLLKGDLSKLTPQQRDAYYLKLCEVTGLNPLMQPFEYIVFKGGKLALYAKKECAAQLRAIHKLSIVDMDQEERDGIYTTTVKIQNNTGRTDMDVGSVNIDGLRGDERGNAIMKSVTKAKRRATLSICGLGLLDELEVETIPGATPFLAPESAAGEDPPPSAPPRQQHKILNEKTGRMVNPNSSNQLRKNGAWESFVDKVQHYRDAGDLAGLQQWYASEAINARISKWPPAWRELADAEFQAAFDALAHVAGAK